MWHFTPPITSSTSLSPCHIWNLYSAHSSGSPIAVFCGALQSCFVHVQFMIHPKTQGDPYGDSFFCVVNSFLVLFPADSNYCNSAELLISASSVKRNYYDLLGLHLPLCADVQKVPPVRKTESEYSWALTSSISLLSGSMVLYCLLSNVENQ